MHHFVGKESNATTAALMASFIVTAIKREASKLYGGDTTPGARAFGKGAAYKIFTRVSEMLATGEVEGLPQSTALRVVGLHKQEQEENEAFIKGSGTELRPGRSGGGSVDLAAFTKGESFGGEIGLNTQVKEQEIIISFLLSNAVRTTWYAIASDCDFVGGDNEAAVELCIDADRLLMYGGDSREMAAIELRKLIAQHTYAKVLSALSTKIALL
jgi:hypothetical protein